MDLESDFTIFIITLVTTLFAEEVSKCCEEVWALFVTQELFLSFPQLFSEDYLDDLMILATRFVAPLGGLDRQVQILMHWCPEDDEIVFEPDDESVPGKLLRIHLQAYKVDTLLYKGL